jgi:3-dehydroquinate dehydratase-2
MTLHQATSHRTHILVINGPNLGLLGLREPEIYGRVSLEEIIGGLKYTATQVGAQITDTQSNHEGDLIDFLNENYLAHKSASPENHQFKVTGIIINPGALAHTSVGLRDALAMYDSDGVPIVEVHLSNTHRREAFRQKSFVSPVSSAIIIGMGATGYRLGLDWLLARKGN